MKNAVSAKKGSCPVSAVATLLSDPWTMLIIHNILKYKSMRFCALERALEGISTRTLTLKLKTLENKNIVIKKESGYILSKNGLALKPVIKAMEFYGKKRK